MSKKIDSIQGLSANKRAITMSACGLIIVSLSLLQLIYWKSIFNTLVERTLVLSPDSKSFEFWKSPPIALTLDFYLFNWTNPEDFYNPKIKPKLQQLGPYSFIEKTDKVDIRWHAHNDSVSYRRRSRFHFDAAHSVGSLDDKIVTMNSLAVTIGRTAQKWSVIPLVGFANVALGIYHISITHTANELLFAGYQDTILDFANIIPSSFLEFKVPFDRYGYCYGRNDSADFYGNVNIHTGADDIRKLGRAHTWKFAEKTKANPAGCNNVRGSMGEFQTPHLKEHANIEYFLPDLCRPMEMEFSEKVEVEGVPAFKYVAGEKPIDNGTQYGENSCYCNGKCMPAGVMNVTSCWYNSPIFMSYPHFYKADPYYLEQVEGLSPQKDLHELYLSLEPETGYIIDMKARLQANILVEPIADLAFLRNARKIVFPLFWLEEKTRITPELAQELKLLPILLIGGRLVGWFGILLGFILCIWRPARQYWADRMFQQLQIDGFDSESVTAAIKANKDTTISSLVLTLPNINNAKS